MKHDLRLALVHTNCHLILRHTNSSHSPSSLFATRIHWVSDSKHERQQPEIVGATRGQSVCSKNQGVIAGGEGASSDGVGPAIPDPQSSVFVLIIHGSGQAVVDLPRIVVTGNQSAGARLTELK